MVKKGDVILGRSAHGEDSDADSNCTIVFSNQTSFFVDEKDELQDQYGSSGAALFLPNNNPAVIRAVEFRHARNRQLGPRSSSARRSFSAAPT